MQIRTTLLLALMAALVLGTAGTAFAQPQEDELSLELLAFVNRSHLLDPADPVATGSVPIDTASTVRLVFGSASKTLAIDLTAPNGEVISLGDPPTAASLSGVFPDPNDPATTGLNYLFALTDPVPGTWSYEIRETAPLAAPRTVLLNVLSSSPLRAGLVGGGETYRVDRDVRLALVAVEGETVLRGYGVSAELSRTDGTPFPAQAVAFLDDGSGADETAGDGLFTSSFQPGAAGSYLVAATVTGTTASGESFERSASTTFRVEPVRATLTGTFNDRGIDVQGDGLLDQVGVAPNLDILEAGDFNLSVRLTAADGSSAFAHQAVTLPLGAASPEVIFTADALKTALTADGPWAVAEVRLEHLGSQVSTADAAFNLGATAAYTLGQLQHPPIDFRGGGSAIGRDFNANGQFDVLDVLLPVNFQRSGFYRWSGRLVDRNSTEIGLASGAASFGSGVHDLLLRFNGRAIGTNGVDGPYFVRNLIVFGVGASLIKDDPLTTDPFTASQFEGFILDRIPPELSVAASPQMLWPPNHEMVEITVAISVTDNVDPDPEVRLESITSNEGDNAIGDGNTSNDIQIDPSGRIFLRAERSGTGNGRVYTLTYSARDDAGNVAFATTTVSVPKSQGKSE